MEGYWPRTTLITDENDELLTYLPSILNKLVLPAIDEREVNDSMQTEIQLSHYYDSLVLLR